MDISRDQAQWQRMDRQGLRTPAPNAVAAAATLAGVQAQIQAAAGLALWNRTAISAADLERLLYAERTLVKLWGQRGTLHLYPSHDWPLIYGGHADLQSSYWERQALRRGEDMAAHAELVATVAALLRERGSLGRSDLRELRANGLALHDDHLSGWGGIFTILVRRGLACHAAPAKGEARMAHREHWLPDMVWAPPDPEAANIELARRYLGAYGPASLHDLAYWRGRSVSAARRWVASLGAEVAELRVGGQPALALHTDLPALAEPAPADDGWPVRLLGRFDPLLLGPRDKSGLVDPARYAQVWRPAGHIEATLLVGGRIAGTWRYDWRGGGLALTMRPFTQPPDYVRQAVDRQAQAVAAHFGSVLSDLGWEAAE